MYGLLLENLSEYVKWKFGEDKWEEICHTANVDYPAFSVHQVYSEKLLPKLARHAMKVLGVTEQEFFENMGHYFVEFVGQYGYDRVLSVLGRHMRDFLNGLDNLHEYLKFSYPRMRAPSFICEHETSQGLTLHYRSKRRGFVYYTMGQIKQVAKHFYNMDLRIDLVHQEIQFDTVHVTFQLFFDNRAFAHATSLTLIREEQQLPVRARVIFEIFPFCIVFGPDMIIRNVGNSLIQILPDLIGKKFIDCFDLVRPLIEFHFDSILDRTNNIFELVTVEPVITSKGQDLLNDDDDDIDRDRNLHLKGQMMFMEEWKLMMYLGTPVMADLESMLMTGMYINDLSMHDFSRDLMLAGTQQSVELKLALDQEQQKSRKLEESMKKLDEEMKRTDELLYQMIPKQVADRLRKGENPIDTCEVFENVTILFSDVVTFTEICSRITPMQVVSMLNTMYSIFDNLTERNQVYKVETIGDAYMVVSGAPVKEQNHAERICDMALDMVENIIDLKDPSTGQHLRIRVGVHTGTVVAGVVGLKMPRYCLFGDSVNTASRLESSSEAMKIHISQYTKDLLPSEYSISERGEVNIKGKGTMKTYWLHDREKRVPFKSSSDGDDLRQRGTNASTSPERRRNVYSPVTLDDVARRSLTGSPVKEPILLPEEPEDMDENLSPPTPPTRQSRRRSSQPRKSQQLLAPPTLGSQANIMPQQEDPSSDVPPTEPPPPSEPEPTSQPERQPEQPIDLPNSIPSPKSSLQNGTVPVAVRQVDTSTMDDQVIQVPVMITSVNSNKMAILNTAAIPDNLCPNCRQAMQQQQQQGLNQNPDWRSLSLMDCCGGFGNSTKQKIQSSTCILL